MEDGAEEDEGIILDEPPFEIKPRRPQGGRGRGREQYSIEGSHELPGEEFHPPGRFREEGPGK